MEEVKLIKIFLASPSDVQIERDLVFSLKDDFDHMIGKPNKIRFEFVNWERSAYPGVGDDAQDVINKAINQDFNIFLGLFWQRFGTPTSRAESGTKEEFDIAYEMYQKNPDNVHIMLYFKTSPADIYQIDIEQFQKVKNFKSEVQDLGVLYYEFNKIDELKSNLMIHLSSIIRDKYTNLDENKSKELLPVEPKDKYELLAEEIENKPTLNVEGLLELSDKANDAMLELPNISDTILHSINFIGEKFTERTNEINGIKNIRDRKLKQKRSVAILNKMANDLNQFSNEIDNVLPSFSSTLTEAIDSYTRLLVSASESSYFIEEVNKQLKTVFPDLYDGIDEALEGIASFLQIVGTFPALTSKFGAAKRNAELSTNNLMKEFIGAKKIMKQLIKR